MEKKWSFQFGRLVFFFRYDLKKRVNDMEMQKEKINEETKDVNEKSSKLADEMETKNKALKELEK